MSEKEDLEKQLAAAMAAEAAPSTSKATLRGALVADKVHPKPAESQYELEMRLRGEILLDLLAKQAAGKDALKDVRKIERPERPDIDEPNVSFKVSLPPQAQNIRLDGMEYYDGFTYDVPPLQAKSMLDIQAQSWKHYRQVRGDNAFADGFRTEGSPISARGQ